MINMSNIVAVYGSLRAGLFNHVVLGNAPYTSMGIAKGFRMHSLGAYPALVRDPDSPTEVVVELYDVSCMKNLDRLEGYPKYYARKQVKIDTPQGAVLAWVYHMERNLTEYHIEGGDWKKWLKGQV